MARRERRIQPRIPVEVEVLLDHSDGSSEEPVTLNLRTRNMNIRGAFIELPEIPTPLPPWGKADWWGGRRVRIHTSGEPLRPGGVLECDAEVRWVERRGPKRRPVGVGVLFLTPSEEWLEALQGFLDSLVT